MDPHPIRSGGPGMPHIALRLFLTCWLVYGLHLATNTVREIFLALSIAEDFSFRVDAYGGMHTDLFELEGRGWHIGNNPGTSMLAAIPYAVVRPLADRIVDRVNRARAASGAEPPEYDSPWPMAREFYREAWRRGYDVKFGIAAIVMQLLCMAPISAFGVVLMFWTLRHLSRSETAALWLTLLYAFGTPVFFRTGFINQNMILTVVGFAGFLMLWHPFPLVTSERRRYLLAGLAGGGTLLLDYTGVVLVGGLFVYGAWRVRDRLQFVWWYAAGTIGPVLLLWFYQYQSFGHPFYPGQAWMPVLQNEFVLTGVRGVSYPDPALALANFFDYRFGLYTSCPLLLLAFAAPWLRHWVPQREMWTIFAVFGALVVFFAAIRYSWLQYNSGVRYLVPAVPLLFLLTAGVLLRLPRALACGLGVLSVYQAWAMAMYRDVERGAGLLEPLLHVTLGGFQLPSLTVLSRIGADLEYIPHGPSPLPIFTLAAGLLYVLWSRRIWTPRDSRQP